MLHVAALAALSSTGCLIAEAPDYGAPRRTAPVIDRLSVQPLPSLLVKMKRDDPPKPFTVTVHSEDNGEKLYGSVILDYRAHPPPEQVIAAVGIPARAADEPKTVTFNITSEKISNGCHSLTLLVTHDTSYDGATQLPIPGVSDGDVAALTWWLHMDPASTDPSPTCSDDTCDPCPGDT